MENHQIFSYQYSARQNREVESIRKKYLPRQVSKLDRLKALDRRVQTAGKLPALVIGVVGCLIFGIGMCFGLDVFAGADRLSVLFCLLGAAVMSPAYPVYRHIAKKTRAELTPQILSLSDEIMERKSKD